MSFQSNASSFSTNSIFNASGVSVFSNTVQIQKQLYANGSAGSTGQILLTAGDTGNVYWGSAESITSSFQTWQVNGASGIKASGGDTVNFISSNNLSITASNTSVKSLTFDVAAANTSVPGIVQLSDAVDNTSITIAATANAVKTAYALAQTAALSATSNASAAYSNAVTYTNTILAGYATTSALTNTASNAYSNAVTYAGTIAATAYSNAVSIASADATGKAAAAYTNAVAYAASNTYVNTQLGLKANLTGATFSGAVSGITTLSTGNTTITGFANIIGNASVSANLTANNIRTTGSVQIDGNLTVSGNTVTVNATNLSVEDNMIYLNSGSAVTHPDLGIAGNYNDGTYRHAGIFRDATDARWKFFDQYVPEPDASPYIDTSNNTFRIADIQANVVYGVTFTGQSNTALTANNAAYLNGQPASYYAGNSQMSSYALLSGATFSGAVSGITTLAAGNTTITGFANVTSSLQVGGTTTIGGLSANGSLGTAGQVLASNGSSTHWATISFSPTIDSVLGNGNTTTKAVTIGDITTTGTLTQSNTSLTTVLQGPLRANNTVYAVSMGVGTNASGIVGEIRATSDVTAYYASDIRLKENVKPIEDALAKVNAIRGVTFDWSEDYIMMRGGIDGYFIRKHDTGIIAQEVEQVLPEVVVTRDNGYKAVNYEKMIGLLIEAVNELTEKVNKLENK
jgi:hypothetical protein